MRLCYGFANLRPSVVHLSVDRVLDMFLMSRDISGMVNIFRNYFILESTGLTHSCRDSLSNTRGTERGVLFFHRWIGRTSLS